MKWRIQFILLVTLMVCLVIGGIHLAEKGTKRVDGDWGSSQSFHITRGESGSLQMTVLGKSYSIEDEGVVPVSSQRQKKPDTLAQDQPQAHNMLSTLGNSFGSWLSGLAKDILARFEKR